METPPPTSPEIIDGRKRGQTADAEPATRERYNTEFIVENFTQRERRNRLIVGVTVLALLGAMGVGMLLSGHKEIPTNGVSEDSPGAPGPNGSAPPATAPNH